MIDRLYCRRRHFNTRNSGLLGSLAMEWARKKIKIFAPQT
jgi:hypothetical protein